MDANRKVYVYDDNRIACGSWTAGTLSGKRGGASRGAIREEARRVESHTRDLSYTVGAAPNYLTDDNRWATDRDSQADADDLFAEWDSDPLELAGLPSLDE